MIRIFYSIFAYLTLIEVYAATPPTFGEYPDGTLISSPTRYDLVGILSLIQRILLVVILPIVVIGGSLYIAYELFTADGDETKMKQAWKSVAYTAVGLVSIAVSYAFISVITRISL